MLSVSESYNKSIVSDYRDMPYRVTFAGAVVLDRSQAPKMTTQESVGGTSGVALGTANSATLKLTLREPADIDYTDMLVEPESGLVLPDGSIEWVPLGKFWVTGVSTRDDYKTVELTCADGMYHLTGDYESDLTYPAPLKSVVREIVTKTGIDFIEPDEWPDVEIRKKPSKTTYRTAIGYCAGCCGKNARFNRKGKLEFVWYTDTGVTIERETQYLNGMTRLNNKPLSVNFEVTGETEKYTITVISDANGNVFPSQGTGIVEGDTITLTVSALYQYELASISAVTDKGAEVPLFENADRSEYTFVQPDSNVTITAAFRGVSGGPYSLVVTSSGNGSITADDSVFEDGDTVTLTVVPDEGYCIKNFTTIPANINLKAVNETTYSFVMPISDVSIAVEFAVKDEHLINTTVAEGEGKITITNATTGGSTYNTGNTIYVSFEGNLGLYESNVDIVQISDDKYKFTMPAYDVSIVAYFDTEKTARNFKMRSLVAPSSITQIPDSSDKVTMTYTNPWIYEKMVPGISEVVQGITYTPANVKHRGNPALQAGDIVTVPDRYGNYHTVLIMQQTMNFGGGMNAEISCPGQTEKTKSFSAIGPLTTQIKNEVNVASAAIERKITANNALVYASLNKSIVMVSQTANANKASVEELVEWRGEASVSLSEVEKKATANEASIKEIARWQGETEKTLEDIDGEIKTTTESLASVTETANRNAATVESIAKWQETTDETLGDLDDRMNTTTRSLASVTETANGNAAEIVSVTEWQQKFRMGTANLIPNSKGDTLEGWDGTSLVEVIEDGEKGHCISIPARNALADMYAYTPRTPRIKQGEAYMLSLDVYATSDAVGNVSILWSYDTDEDPADDEKGPTYYYERVPLYNGSLDTFEAWHRLTIPFTTSNDVRTGYVYIGVKRAADSSSAGYLRIANIQLERGTVATDWKPYSEDVATTLSLAEVRQKATANGAAITSLTEWQTDTEKSLAEIEQKADKNGASIELLVEYDEDGEPVAKGSVLVEAINGQSAVKLKADVIDLEGNVTADALKVTDADGNTIFDAGSGACVIGGSVVATAAGLVAPKALTSLGQFKATMTANGNRISISNYGTSSRYNNEYKLPGLSNKALISGWSVGDKVAVMYGYNVPEGNQSNVPVIFYHEFDGSESTVYEVSLSGSATGEIISLIINRSVSAECNIGCYNLRLSNEGLLGGTLADGGEFGGYLKIGIDEAGLVCEIETGDDSGVSFHADAMCVRFGDLDIIEIPETPIYDASVSKEVSVKTLGALVSTINTSLKTINDKIANLEVEIGGTGN